MVFLDAVHLTSAHASCFWCSAVSLLFALMMFIIEHSLFLPTRTAALLATFLLAFLLGGALASGGEFEQFLGKGTAGEPAVDFT